MRQGSKRLDRRPRGHCEEPLDLAAELIEVRLQDRGPLGFGEHPEPELPYLRALAQTDLAGNLSVADPLRIAARGDEVLLAALSEEIDGQGVQSLRSCLVLFWNDAVPRHESTLERSLVLSCLLQLGSQEVHGYQHGPCGLLRRGLLWSISGDERAQLDVPAAQCLESFKAL
jgi:hypothetical protein